MRCQDKDEKPSWQGVEAEAESGISGVSLDIDLKS